MANAVTHPVRTRFAVAGRPDAHRHDTLGPEGLCLDTLRLVDICLDTLRLEDSCLNTLRQ